MACTYSSSVEYVSDSDLESGLPSPDESDDDQKSTDIGIVVPYFCNKLREQTKPLLSLSHGVPSLTPHLREHVTERSKESKAKKRLVKGRQQPSSGVIERRYGYIPNPRWPKTYTHSRPYEPVGIGDKDREGVPGVVFREKQKTKSDGFESSYEHSYQESEFPILNISASDRSQKCDTSVSLLHSSHLEESSNTSAALYQNEPDLIDTSLPINSMKMTNTSFDSHASPSTSTPIKRGDIICQATPSPVFYSVESSLCNSDSAGSTHSPVKNCVASDILQNVKGSRSKKLGPNSPVNNSSSFSLHDDTVDSPSLPNSKQGSSLISGVLHRNSIWSDKKTLGSGTHINEKDSFPPLTKMNHTFSSNADVAFTRQLSPALGDKSSKSENNSLYTHTVKSPVASDTIKPVTVTSSSAWSQVARGSDQKNLMLSSRPLSSRKLNSQTEKSEHLSPSAGLVSSSTEQSDLCDLGKPHKDKRTRSRNRNLKTLDNSSSDDVTNKKYPISYFTSEGSQTRMHNFSRGSNRNGNSVPRTLTLESFITPQKNIKKKNGILKDKNDFDLFHGRFIERLSANAISPPKKIRPSPIKKLSFSKQDEAVSDSGDNNKFNVLHDDCKELQNLKQTTEMKLDESGDKTTSVTKGHKTKLQLGDNQEDFKRSSTVFSLENRPKNEELQKRKDVFEEENENEDEYAEKEDHKEANTFWALKSVNRRQPTQTSDSKLTIPCEPNDDDDDLGAAPYASGWKQQKLNEWDAEDRLKDASFSKVTHKSILRKYARRYCHFIEEHQVPNLATELYFIIQLLTCTDVDMDVLSFIDRKGWKTYFRSLHNGVYFAVIVIKRLRRLFLALDKTYLELLAACPRIQAFSPKLHKFFVQAIESRVDPVVPASVEHITFIPQEDGTMSFPDTNNAHVFKCQRDNFYAFYRHYHDTSRIYEFRIENQIQYIYDGCTPEQNSVVNFMHLAKLYLDHMILCCVQQTEEQVDVLKMIQSKVQDEKLFTSLFKAFSETSSTSNVCPLPGFSNKQMFFKDFIETLSCPAFNEHLKNLVVFRILELNATDFNSVLNLHSAVTVAEGKTPLRSGKFTETVKTLCVLGKLLGYLTFMPYTSGTQTIFQDHVASLLTMREMNPLPVPLLLLLKQAFDNGHLCLTVPWIVEYLAMMDQLAPQLSVYRSLLKKLHFIQRYAWTSLYKVGHHYSGLLIVSCISWLFQTPALPEGFFFSYDDADEISRFTHCSRTFCVDQQKLVCQQLLSWCCPYLEQGQSLLALFLLKQPSVTTERSVLPVSQPESSSTNTANITFKKEVAEIEKWLGTSFGQETEVSDSRKPSSLIDDEVVPAYVLTRLLARQDTDELADLELHLTQSSPFLKSSIDTTVDLLYSKITDFTNKMILKLLVFEAKAEVRMLFQGVSPGIESDAIKDNILAEVNVIAYKYCEKAKESYCELCDRSTGKELSDLLLFLTSNVEENMQQNIVHITKKIVVRRLQEWANVQLEPTLFRRVIVREAEKCSKTTTKFLSLYPNDYSKKLEELSCPDLNPGFTEQEQLSELIDRALSYGVWYINALSPGVRPDDMHIVHLIEDITNCIKKKMITMDFAFSVMTNFLLHLIIQYIVDAPQNWTQQAEDAFVRLCCMCKERKLDNGKVYVNMPDSMKKKKKLMVKVLNLLSVFSIQWLEKSESPLETLMAYCRLISRLVIAQLLYVETVYKKLVHSRENGHLDASAKVMVNKVLIKILQMLYENEDAQNKSCSPERILTLVKDLSEPLQTIPQADWDNVLSDLAVRTKSTFGCILDLSFQCAQY